LALLGASPPAVKGLEPFNFAEVDGVFDYAVALAPSDLFDDELGPTMLVDKSPLEMLQEKLAAVREDVSSAVKDLQAGTQNQPVNQLQDVAGSSVTSEPEAAQMANPESTQYSENKKTVGREGTEIAQQTADLENQFPEEEFMDQGSISRKRAKGANGQVMQVVENVYEESHKESTDERKAAADRAAEAKRLSKEGKSGESKMVKRFGKEEDKLISEDHAELEYDEVSYKTNPSQGVVKFGKKSEPSDDDDTGRYETARSSDNGYVDRMKTGKSGADGATGRFKTAKSGAQDTDRLDTPHSGEQDEDRMNTAEAGPDGDFGCVANLPSFYVPI
jgi:hypothetical protein